MVMLRAKKLKTGFGTDIPQQKPNKNRKAGLIKETQTIQLQFSPDPSLNKEIKKLYQFKQNKGKPLCRLSFESLFKLKALGFTLSQTLKDFYNYYFGKKRITVPEITGLRYPLFQYQREGVALINHFKGRCILTDEQGLGKTAQVIAWANIRPQLKYPILVLCPSSLKLNWKSEFESWLINPPSIQILSGYEKTNIETNITADVVIVNYDVLVSSDGEKEYIRQDILDYPFKTAFVDEAHYVNNINSQRGWAVSEIAKKVKYFIPMTATPSKNKPKHLYHLINMTNPLIFPNEYRFLHRYCGAKKNYVGGWDYNGSSKESELNTILKNTVMIRRRKLDVFKELDRKLRQVIPLEIDNRDEYDDFDMNFEMVSENSNFVKIEQLKQLAVKGKMKQMFNFIDDMLKTTDKIVIFAEHHETVDLLMERYKDIAVKIDGRTSDKKKDEAKYLFQRCKKCGIKKEYHTRDENACDEYEHDLSVRVIIGSTAMCVGHTLTASDVVIFTELWWSPQDHDQAEDRCYGRAGDLHGCTAYYLIAEDTIEEAIAGIYDLKNKMSTRILDGRELSTDEILTELMKGG